MLYMHMIKNVHVTRILPMSLYIISLVIIMTLGLSLSVHLVCMVLGQYANYMYSTSMVHMVCTVRSRVLHVSKEYSNERFQNTHLFHVLDC